MSAAERLPLTVPHLKLMADNDSRNTPTEASPPPEPRETPTNPAASPGPVIPRAPGLPENLDDLGGSVIASRQPPAWWADSFLAAELNAFARGLQDAKRLAKDLREGRDQQHVDAMAAIKDLGRKQDAGRGEVREMLARMTKRIIDIESGQRRMGQAIEHIESNNRERDAAEAQERREIRSILTAVAFRLDMIEQNGHQGTQSLENRRILVIDDEQMLNKYVQRALVKQGATVDLAGSWAEVMELVEGGARYDFALVDLRLGSDDGLQVSEWLQRRAAIPDGCLAIMTGHLSADQSALAEQMQVRVLEKPFASSTLVSTILEALDATPGSKEPAPPG